VLDTIKKLCEKKNLSISALENRLNVGHGTIASWDKSSPRVCTLKQVADFFGVTIDDLIKDDAI